MFKLLFGPVDRTRGASPLDAAGSDELFHGRQWAHLEALEVYRRRAMRRFHDPARRGRSNPNKTGRLNMSLAFDVSALASRLKCIATELGNPSGAFLMRLRLNFILFGLVLATDCDDSATVLIQNQLKLHETKPWDRRTYVAGTNHKAGSQLLRNVMCHIFDTLGATQSCQYHGSGPSVTTLDRDNDCYDAAPNQFHIRFHNHIHPQAIRDLRNETKGKLRVVMIIRNPMEMLASSYCYHHRGAEPGSPIPPAGIMSMGPKEGVPAMAKSLMNLIINGMVKAATMSGDDLMVVKHEDFTKNSKSFDSTAARN